MSQKAKLLELLQTRKQVREIEAKQAGIRNPRPQIGFLRKDGYIIIHTGEKETYRML